MQPHNERRETESGSAGLPVTGQQQILSVLRATAQAIGLSGSLAAPTEVNTQMPEIDPGYISAVGEAISTNPINPSELVNLLRVPSPREVSAGMQAVSVEGILQAERLLVTTIARQHEQRLLEIHEVLSGTTEGAGADLKNIALIYLTALDRDKYWELARTQAYHNGSSVADRLTALACLVASTDYRRNDVNEGLLSGWKGEADRGPVLGWLYTEASRATMTPDEPPYYHAECLRNRGAYRNTVVDGVPRNMGDPDPRAEHAVYVGFTDNYEAFHHPSGRGYSWALAAVKTLASKHPEIAIEIVDAFAELPRLDRGRREMMTEGLQDLVETPRLPREVLEAASEILKRAPQLERL